MDRRSVTCCFTGHRDIPRDQVGGIIIRTETIIRKLIVTSGVQYFGVGGAPGPRRGALSHRAPQLPAARGHRSRPVHLHPGGLPLGRGSAAGGLHPDLPICPAGGCGSGRMRKKGGCPNVGRPPFSASPGARGFFAPLREKSNDFTGKTAGESFPDRNLIFPPVE